MPELPDISAYITALESRIVGEPIEHVRLATPFLLRTVEPPIASVEGRRVCELRRIGKRIAIGVEDDLWLVLHLMIAGRLHWRAAGAKLAGRNQLAAFDFPNGSLVLTEAGAKRRASLHVLKGEESLRTINPGGIDVFASDPESVQAALAAENRTLKRALTDARIVSGIGNAYSDEILHAAQLSPITLTRKLTPPEWGRLFIATRSTLERWIDKLQSEARVKFPEKVTAFREDMAMHGHIFTERRHFFGELHPGFALQLVNPAFERGAGCDKQPAPSGWSEFPRKRNRRELCRVQNLIRISIADTTNDPRVSERPLQSAVLSSKRCLKRFRIARENVDSSRIDCPQTLLAFENVQGSAPLRPSFRQHQRAVWKIESGKLIASRQLGSDGTPMQPSGDHQVKHQPQIVFHTNCDALADAPQLAHLASFNASERRLYRAQQEGVCQPYMFDGFTDDASLQRDHVRGDVGEFWHEE